MEFITVDHIEVVWFVANQIHPKSGCVQFNSFIEVWLNKLVYIYYLTLNI